MQWTDEIRQKNLLQKIFKNYSWLKCRTLKFIIWFNSGSADAVESFDDKDKFIIWFNSGSADAVESFDDKDKFIIWSKVIDFNDGEADETITED